MMKRCFLVLLLSLLSLCHSQNYYYDTTTVCSDSSVTVTSLELLCDTPGTFYYGSGGYRNSETCQAGDKAKMAVYFDIEDDYLDDDITVTISVSAPSGSEKAIVYKDAQLCYIGALKALNGTGCPSTGSYVIEASFYYSITDDAYAGDDDGNESFTPTISVGFASSASYGEYDLGGANTNNCAGDSEEKTFENYTNKTEEASPLAMFLWSFGVLVATIGAIGVFAWFINRRTACIDRICLLEDDMLDEDVEKKSQLVGKTKGLIIS